MAEVLVLAEHSTIDDFALDVLAVDQAHSQFNQPVGKQNARTGIHFA